MARALKDGTIVLNAKEAATARERLEREQEKKGGPDRPRRRAAERNEKTDSITKERRRIRELKAERERLAGLLEDMAEEVGAKGGRIDWGEGLAHRILTDEDLLRIAELIDPDD